MLFFKENGSDSYYRYNKGLIFEERQKVILAEMDAAENALDRGIHFTEKSKKGIIGSKLAVGKRKRKERCLI